MSAGSRALPVLLRARSSRDGPASAAPPPASTSETGPSNPVASFSMSSLRAGVVITVRQSASDSRYAISSFGRIIADGNDHRAARSPAKQASIQSTPFGR